MEMDENPYAPPLTSDLAVGVKSWQREDVKSVAVAQKAIMICILLQLVGGAAQFVVPPKFRLYISIIGLLVLLASFVSCGLLAMKVCNIGLGIVYGIGSLLPCLGLLILLIVNQRATKILRDNGHNVGFLGADLSKF